MGIRVKGHILPLSAILGMGVTAFVWIVLVLTQTYSRWLGIGWIALGVGMYFLIRKRKAPVSTLDLGEWTRGK
jgi:uncharacterized membrane protein